MLSPSPNDSNAAHDWTENEKWSQWGRDKRFHSLFVDRSVRLLRMIGLGIETRFTETEEIDSTHSSSAERFECCARLTRGWKTEPETTTRPIWKWKEREGRESRSISLTLRRLIDSAAGDDWPAKKSTSEDGDQYATQILFPNGSECRGWYT